MHGFIEFKAIPINNTGSGVTAWWDNVRFEDYSPAKTESGLNYKIQMNGSAIIYKFNRGDRLELKVSHSIIAPGEAVYTTGEKGNYIIFLGDKHEKLIGNTARILIPVIMELKDVKLKQDETIDINNGYAINLNNISNQSLQFTVLYNNKTVRNILSQGNSSIEYWMAPDGYKREKVFKLSAIKIYPEEVTFDLTQYTKKIEFFVGKKFEDFQVTTITQNSLIMKNIKPLAMEDGQKLSLLNNSIKIKV